MHYQHILLQNMGQSNKNTDECQGQVYYNCVTSTKMLKIMLTMLIN